MLNCLRENLGTALELSYGHKFAGAMGNADIPRTEDDGFGAQANHAGRFSAEGDRARRFAGALLEKSYQL